MLYFNRMSSLPYLGMASKTFSSCIFLIMCFLVHLLLEKYNRRFVSRELQKFVRSSSIESLPLNKVPISTLLQGSDSILPLISTSIRNVFQKQLCVMLSLKLPTIQSTQSTSNSATEIDSINQNLIPINREKKIFTCFQLPIHREYLSFLCEKIESDLNDKLGNNLLKFEEEFVYAMGFVERIIACLVSRIFTRTLADYIELIEHHCFSSVSNLFWVILWDCFDYATLKYLTQAVKKLKNPAFRKEVDSYYFLIFFLFFLLF